MSNLKQAAQQVHDNARWINDEQAIVCYEDMMRLRAALAEPEQEPVAYDKTELNCFAQDLYDKKMREGKRGHYESMFHVIHQCIKKVVPPQLKPEQEPVAWVYDCGNGGRMYAEDLDGVEGWAPLYTAPPQRKPLTKEEIWEALSGIDCTRPLLISRAIEAAHGIGEKT